MSMSILEKAARASMLAAALGLGVSGVFAPATASALSDIKLTYAHCIANCGNGIPGTKGTSGVNGSGATGTSGGVTGGSATGTGGTAGGAGGDGTNAGG